ncbi:MAG: glycosyltransferase 87 family protein [Trebonia sp.]
MTAKAARVAGIAACLVVLTGVILLIAHPHLVPTRIAGLGTARIQTIELEGLAWVAFGCAAWLARKSAVKIVVGLVLIGGIALQVAALSGPPRSSTDLYRYIWDGRVQAAGIDPYLYAPADAGVAQLRNDFLWPGTGTGHPLDCGSAKPDSADPADSVVAGCTKINRLTVPTIYPPVAEAYFTAVQLAAPADDSTTPIQAGAAGFAVLTTVILLFGLRRYGRDPRLAALWAWCPTVALEAGQNGHVDVVGVAFTATALLVLAGARAKRKIVLGGVLLGLAIATKMTPVLAVPGVLRRGWRLIAAAAVAAVAAVYVPHVIAVGSKVIGFLPGYLNQQGYSNGTGYAVLGLFVHGKTATVVAVVILGLVAAAILRYCDPDRPWHGGVLMTSAALVVCTPEYQWYSILLVMLVALDGQPEWLLLSAAGYLGITNHVYVHGFMLRHTQLIGYGGGAAIAGAIALTRVFLSRRASRLAVPADGAPVEGVPADDVLADDVPALVIEPTAVFAGTGSYRVLTTGEMTERTQAGRP